MICKVCGQDKPLILNVCSDCDPELHEAWDKALKSCIDFETVTPEIEKAYKLIEERKQQLRDF